MIFKIREETWLKYLMILPLLLITIFLSIIPLAHLIRLAFSSYDFTEGSTSFNGLTNFFEMVKDTLFLHSVRNTLVYVTASIVVEFLIGLGLALLVRGVLQFKSLIRTLFLVPMLVAPVAVGLVWKLIYRPDIGIINIFLRSVGLGSYAQVWLADVRWAMPAIVIVEVWQWTPFVFLFLLAGLEFIPREPYEAASIDGASSWQKFWYITLPLLRPAIFIVLLLRTIDLFKAFDKFYILTSGGPGNATEILSLRVYKVSFQFLELGYGSFLAIITVAIIIIYTLTYYLLMRRIA